MKMNNIIFEDKDFLVKKVELNGKSQYSRSGTYYYIKNKTTKKSNYAKYFKGIEIKDYIKTFQENRKNKNQTKKQSVKNVIKKEKQKIRKQKKKYVKKTRIKLKPITKIKKTSKK